MAEENIGPVIRHPSDPQWIERLRREQERAKAYILAHGFRAPELMIYQWAIVELAETLLAGTAVGTWDVSRKLNAKYGTMDIKAFESACTLIEDICITGGVNSPEP